ncbi:MAG: hypothetical protein J6Y78_08640 [Paludibacteraceae bacterium]|nr:hypothetical protein [Paludibacteraceae bacterium]
MAQIRIEDIKQAIVKADFALRPWMVILHPDVAKSVKEAWPEIEDNAVVIATPYCDKDKAYLVNREETIWEYGKDFQSDFKCQF